MIDCISRRGLATITFVSALLRASPPAAGADTAEIQGQRIFVCGHSFHMPVANMLPEIEKLAGIKNQQPVAQQRMDGSTVTQHWNLAEDKNLLKQALIAGKVDDLTLSPTSQLQDEGIDKFTELAMAHNPNTRIFVQASWVGFDSTTANPRTFKNEQRDTAKPDDLRKDYDPFYKIMCDQARKLNDHYSGSQKRQVVYVVPVAYAVIALREKVAEGKAPGIVRQSELFRDDRGHGKPSIYLLASYCNYASIYGRSPVGISAPASLMKEVKPEYVEPLNHLLEEIAWEAVTNEPLTGVKNFGREGKPLVMQELPERKASSAAPKTDDAPTKPAATADATSRTRPAAASRGASEQQLQMMLGKFPDADLNKDGKLTMDEFREFRRKKPASTQEKAHAPPPTPASPAPSAQTPATPPAGTTDSPVTPNRERPLNRRGSGTGSEKKQGLDSTNAAFAVIKDDPALPRVLLIGDSISIGYTPAVREHLAGKANVHRPATNCGNTTKGLTGLDQWVGEGPWNVIHFNFGLHDVTSVDGKPEVTFDQYEKNLRDLVARLKKTGATLLWCSTTPVPPARRAPLDPEDVVRYNAAAKKIMDENGIAIDDLFSFAMPQQKEIQNPTNVHPTDEGFKVLARQVAASIDTVLQHSKATAGKTAN